MRLFPSIGVSLRILKRFNQIVHPMSTISDSNITEISTVLRNIYSSSPRNIFSCHVTGGGAELLHWLFTVPGASNSVIDASVPYSRESLNKLVGPIPDFSGSCSSETALVMAKAAYHNTFYHLLSGDTSLIDISESNVFGVSCTAALVSDRPKKGAHRFHIGIYNKDSSITYSVELDKSKLRSRLQEDRVCSRAILDAISLSCNIPLPQDSLLLSQQRASQLSADEIVGDDEHTGASTEIPVVKQLRNPSLVESIERVSSRLATHTLFINKPDLTTTTHNTANDNNGDKIDVSIATQPLLDKQQEQLATQFVCFEGAQLPPNSIIYSGSFNPLHIGHISLVRAEIELTLQNTLNETSNSSTGSQTSPAQQPLVIFELPVVNADKPALPAAEVTRRLLQFNAVLHPLLRGLRYAVCITSEPLFVGKSSIFQGSRFVIGADTFSRLIDSKYYKTKHTATATDSCNNNSGDVNVQERENTKAMLNMIAALTTIKNNNCTFVVGGRVKQNAPAVSTVATTTTQQPPIQQVFETLESIVRDTEVCTVLPESVLSMFRGLSESQFRLDLSSTEIRNKMKQK